MDEAELLKQMRKTELRLAALMERRRRCMELEGCLSAGRAEEVAALRGELEAQAGEYVALARAAEDMIERVSDDTRRDVLRYRYLNGWSWREIAARMHYSADWVKHVHSRALEELRKQA